MSQMALSGSSYKKLRVLMIDMDNKGARARPGSSKLLLYRILLGLLGAGIKRR
jgi:hypothetical protein